MQHIKTALKGTLIQKGEDGYDDARKVYNAMIDKYPSAIAYCNDVADVIQCVNFARDNGHVVSVRGGGHNAGGLGIWDDALVIDLSRINSVRVDAEKKTVRVGGGCTWGDVDKTTYPHGLAVPTGIISTTGVGGLTLGGGVGNFTRQFGLTIDNLLEVDMVLADGSTTVANENQNSDLFWAVRGGGGNFGIVTSFLFRGNPAKDIYGGPTLWTLDKTEEVLKWYRDFIIGARGDLNGWFAFITVPPVAPFPESLQMKKVCGVVWCYSGPHDQVDEAFAPVKAMNPDLYGVHDMPFPALNSAFDALYPPGHQWYWRADFIDEISDAAVDEHIKFAAQMPSPQTTMHLYPIHGKAHQKSNQDTAWSYRQSNWAQVMVGVHPDDSLNEELISWARAYYDAIHPHSAGGAYVNFLMDEGQDRIKATYRGNYERLADIKKKFDPKNFFRVNQNIRPSGS
jgi:FAD/FMN-containing dehydrogenase